MLRYIESPVRSSDGFAAVETMRDAWSLRMKVPARRCLRRKFFHFFHQDGSAVITASTNSAHPGSLSVSASAPATSSGTPVVGFFASSPASWWV